MKINKKIAGSFVTIAAVLTAVVGITFAQFSDTASLTGNTLSTTTPNLKIATDTCSSYSTSKVGVSSNNLAPGEFGTRNFCLKNASNGDLAFNITAIGTVTSGDLDTSLINVTVDCGLGPKNINLDGVTASDLIVNIPVSSIANCVIKQTFSGAATNSASAKSIQYNVAFTGTQS